MIRNSNINNRSEKKWNILINERKKRYKHNPYLGTIASPQKDYATKRSFLILYAYKKNHFRLQSVSKYRDLGTTAPYRHWQINLQMIQHKNDIVILLKQDLQILDLGKEKKKSNN